MVTLAQEFGTHAGRVITVELPRIRFGRAPDNEVVFDANTDLDASARHCEIVQAGAEWEILDLGSRNGTFVNGQRINRQGLKVGDTISCGRAGPRLRIVWLDGASHAASSPGSTVVRSEFDPPGDYISRRNLVTRAMLLVSVILLVISFLSTLYLVFG